MTRRIRRSLQLSFPLTYSQAYPEAQGPFETLYSIELQKVLLFKAKIAKPIDAIIGKI